MKESKPNRSNPHPIRNSILATAGGYSAGMVGVVIWTLLSGGTDQYLGFALLMVAWCMAVVVGPCWALVVLPMWIRLPADSSLWRLGRASAAGALIGSALMTIFIVVLNVFRFRSDYQGLVILIPIAAIVGSTTGLLSATLHRRGSVTSPA